MNKAATTRIPLFLLLCGVILLMSCGTAQLLKNKITELQPVKRAFSISGSLITAEIATHWINSGILERLTRWQTNEIKARSGSIHEILKGYKYQYSPYGLFLWLQLPEPIRAVDIVLAAKDRNVIVLEAERFMIGRGAAPHSIRISITSAQSKELFEEGLKILSDLMNKSKRLSI